MMTTDDPAQPGFKAAARLWLKIGLISFGGPAAQIAILQEELVDRRRWIDQRSFLTALNFCMLLPGPEAQQLATYLGLRLHGLKGALAAGGLFVLPGALLMFGLAWIAAAGGGSPPVQAVFHGFLPVVVALVAHAVWRIGKRTLSSRASWAVAVAAFVAIGLMGVALPWVIAAAVAAGLAADRFGLSLGSAGHAGGVTDADIPIPWRRQAARAAVYTAVFAVLWVAPVGLVLLLAGTRPFADVAVFFSQAALVTFGGAYAVLPFVAKGAVAHYAWLSPVQMVQGLALAETTPGPLILVTQYVGFFAGWNTALAGHAGSLSPLAAAAIAAALTTWVTFLPCFYFVLIGAPLMDGLARNRHAHAALSGVGAAVVGVIASLGLLVGRAAFWVEQRVDILAVILALAALFAAIRLKVPAVWLVALGAVAGLLRWRLGV